MSTQPSTEPGRLPPALEAACALLVAAAALYVFLGCLHVYFAQEDFRGLAVAAGVLPRHAALWRWVSVQGFMDLFYPWFRDDSRAYHALLLGIHALNAALLFRFLVRPCGPPAALVGATFFAVHPALFTALYWQSARADVLAAFFALVTLVLALRPGRERWLALPAFALALLCKESVLPLPLAVWLIRRWREGPKRPALDSISAALALIAVAYALYLFLPKQVGIRIGFDPVAAYGLDLGASAWRNLLTYVGWAVDLARLTPGLRYVDTQNPALFPLAAVVLVAGAFLCGSPALRRRGLHLGLVCFLLLLVPVLPLRNHTYHYYLYAPLLACALCPAALLRVAFDRISARGLPWALAALMFLALVWNGARLVDHMEARRMQAYPDLHGDPTVDRALIAERAIRTIRQASIPAGTEMVFRSRERMALLGRILRGSGEPFPSQEESYPESNVRTALFDGIAVKALIPAVDSVVFNRSVGEGTARRRYAIYARTGEMEVYDGAELDSLLRTSWVGKW